jgi:hypothetical protein
MVQRLPYYSTTGTVLDGTVIASYEFNSMNVSLMIQRLLIVLPVSYSTVRYYLG